MEYVDIVDENNNLTGRFTERQNLQKFGYWHRIIIAWVVNEKNEILFQKRASIKKYNPNIWSITGGQILKGETPLEGAMRELNEELGIENNKQNRENMQLIDISITKGVNNGENVNRFIYEYLLKTNKKIEEFKLQKEEVSEVKYMTIKEIKDIREDIEISKQYTSDLFRIEKIEQYLSKEN